MTAGQWVVVVVAGLVTYAIRASFLLFADRMVGLPTRVQVMLRMIPAAAIAAIVVPALLRPGGGGYDVLTPLVAGAVVTALVSRWRRDIGLSLAAGLVVVTVLQQLVG